LAVNRIQAREEKRHYRQKSTASLKHHYLERRDGKSDKKVVVRSGNDVSGFKTGKRDVWKSTGIII
jgi:hypothetical protein